MFPESLVAARKLLEEITPLQTDCGLVCGGACCQTHPGEETGMLLFPGEAEMYRGEDGFTLVDSPHGTILVCEGRCSRANRPLACRMFPCGNAGSVIAKSTVSAGENQRAFCLFGG